MKRFENLVEHDAIPIHIFLFCTPVLNMKYASLFYLNVLVISSFGIPLHHAQVYFSSYLSKSPGILK